jgi:alkylation response protein AidB-like acyl-CoA dehydrogenase
VIDFARSEEQRAVDELAGTLVKQVIDPVARGAGAHGDVPKTTWAQLLDSGLVAPVAVEYGGGGVLDALSSMIGAEELAAGDVAIAAAAVWSGHAAVLIGRCGTDQQRADLLLRLLIPSTRGAVALFERFGRAPSEYQTTISRYKDRWRVSGRKSGVAAGSAADPLIIVGTDPTEGNRLRAVILPSAVSGEVTAQGGPI